VSPYGNRNDLLNPIKVGNFFASQMIGSRKKVKEEETFYKRRIKKIKKAYNKTFWEEQIAYLPLSRH
jgi:hypothetical protein